MRILYYHTDHCKNCRMMRIKETIKLWILSVNSKCILRQIICSNAEEINLLCKLTAYHNSCWCLNHNTLLRLSIGNTLLIKLCLYFFYDFLNLSYFPKACDHRIHD